MAVVVAATSAAAVVMAVERKTMMDREYSGGSSQTLRRVLSAMAEHLGLLPSEFELGEAVLALALVLTLVLTGGVGAVVVAVVVAMLVAVVAAMLVEREMEVGGGENLLRILENVAGAALRQPNEFERNIVAPLGLVFVLVLVLVGGVGAVVEAVVVAVVVAMLARRLPPAGDGF